MWMDVDVALAEVPVNLVALIDDTDFKTREESVAYNQAGMDLVWNFVTTAGAYTQTAVVPTTAGLHDWASQGNAMYSIEIPASGGTINNDTEGFGWFTGFATGVLPWTGPVIGFRAAGLNNLMIDSAYSATRGLAGTALPAAAADAAGGLAISDVGALDLDTILGRITADVALASICTEARLAELAAANLPTDVGTVLTRIGTPSNLGSGADLANNGVDIAAYLDTEIAAILALLDDVRAEPGQGAPPVNPDAMTKLDYIYKVLRNLKTQTSTTWSLMADDGVTVDQKATVSDVAGTATFGELVSGP